MRHTLRTEFLSTRSIIYNYSFKQALAPCPVPLREGERHAGGRGGGEEMNLLSKHGLYASLPESAGNAETFSSQTL